MAPPTQIKGKKFTVVYRDEAKQRSMLALLRTHGGRTYRDYQRRKIDYIVIDLSPGCTRIDIPIDEPWTAFSPENMVRLYGYLWKEGVLLSPQSDVPRIVTGEWVKAAISAWVPYEPIEGRYVDRESSYFRQLGGSLVPPVPAKSVTFAIGTKFKSKPGSYVKRFQAAKEAAVKATKAAGPKSTLVTPRSKAVSAGADGKKRMD